MILTARALAFVRGREYVVPQDIEDMALDVMRHRLVLSYEALSDGVTGDMIVQRILEQMPSPRAGTGDPHQCHRRGLRQSCSALTGR